jgi:hypothetical protein
MQTGMTTESRKIDFVLPWVDGSDSAWIARKREYEGGDAGQSSDFNANGDCRYRDMGLLRYWFRAVERFAPWVNKVFFVTCGQKPEWLDETHPKLRLVDHRDYIPTEHLPTFNARAINLNLHRIAGLAEHFVLFDDDMFLLRPRTPRDFFRGGLPVLPCDLGIPYWLGTSHTSRVVVNNCGYLKRSMDVDRLVRKNIAKFADVLALGPVRAAKNVLAFAVNRTVLQGCFGHLALPHLKSTFEEVWAALPEVLERTSRHRFRDDNDVNQWIFASWNLVKGRFKPGNEKRMGGYVVLREGNLAGACEAVRRQRWPQICLNDAGAAADFGHCSRAMGEAFAAVLPEKSSFEK